MTIIVSIIALIVVFTVKKPKAVGCFLLVIGVIMLIATNVSGIVSWVLFFVGGVSAIRYKEISVPPTKNISPLDILKERYAKGEISQEEFYRSKSELEE